MWFVWLLIIIAVVVAWLVYGAEDHCPSCGIALDKQFGAPWKRVDHCRCGWRRNDVL